MVCRPPPVLTDRYCRCQTLALPRSDTLLELRHSGFEQRLKMTQRTLLSSVVKCQSADLSNVMLQPLHGGYVRLEIGFITGDDVPAHSRLFVHEVQKNRIELLQDKMSMCDPLLVLIFL